MVFKKYNSKPLVLIDGLDGKIEIIPKDIVLMILEKFRRNQKYTLENHPRILTLKHFLKYLKIFRELRRVEEISIQSFHQYELVCEYGDFAPRKIIYAEEKYTPFDFEYFVEDGLEYL